MTPDDFAALYEECAPKIYHYLRARLRGPNELAEDLTADVFLKAFLKLDGYQDRGAPPIAWLYRIAHNRMVDYLRSPRELETFALDVVGDRAEPGSDLEIGRVVDRHALDVAISRLTAEQRQAIEMQYWSSSTALETGVVMGRSEDTVKKLRARGLARMRRLLGAEPRSA
jgi:RNA polymerase sigma-70 factor (ECF subfamily)